MREPTSWGPVPRWYKGSRVSVRWTALLRHRPARTSRWLAALPSPRTPCARQTPEPLPSSAWTQWPLKLRVGVGVGMGGKGPSLHPSLPAPRPRNRLWLSSEGPGQSCFLCSWLWSENPPGEEAPPWDSQRPPGPQRHADDIWGRGECEGPKRELACYHAQLLK